MYKRKDNDIFGTQHLTSHPKIDNQSYIDPHAAFKRKTEQKYEAYTAQLNNVHQTITKKTIDSTQVNEKVQFGQNYHKNRKQKDMQSQIFYPPTAWPKQSNDTVQSENDPFLANKSNIQPNHGRKDTLKRQINEVAYNNSEFKGNSSRLFDLNERIDHTNRNKENLIPLIPHGMQWDQHDSVKYSHINYNNKEHNEPSKTIGEQRENLEKNIQILHICTTPQQKTTSGKDSQPQEQKLTKPANSVEVKVLKGWSPKFMQGLAKYCKLNKSAILNFCCQQSEKASILLKRSDRWENVTDWMRKDCKMKIRVIE